ncbi:MAG: hypothetical protein L6W00_01995 [Lentisphaeria bacterium]|nr:MAG: hypothetical protein L6W00_01995 [Lentisphaeria bacterium]
MMQIFQIPGVRWRAEVPEAPVRELRLSGRFHRCSARLFRFDFTIENGGRCRCGCLGSRCCG